MRESRRARSTSATLLAALALFAGGCVSVDESSSGHDIYERICSRCHGTQLDGGVGPALDGGSDAAGRDDGYWIQTISRGRGRMPSFQSTLSDEQIQRVIDYAREVQGQ